MPIAITEEQQRQFEEDGFFLIEDLLSPDEIAHLIQAIDVLDTHYRKLQNIGPAEAFQVRNAVAQHEAFLPLMDHPAILPLIVDLLGCNIQIRTSHMDVRPPISAEHANKKLGVRGSFFPWHSDGPTGGPDFGYPITKGIVPFIEIKVGYYLTDLTEHNSGSICVVRGSHKMSPELLYGEGYEVPEDKIFEVNVKAGTAMVWRTALWHCLTPNLTSRTRKCLYYGYHHRWIRPSDYMHQDPALIARCTPIQKQLLGELGTGDTNYSGDNLAQPAATRYWHPQEGDVPLQTWMEAQEQKQDDKAAS
jgi:ectoine hydroxylase-related dioxygenase (phytanoyl-CoA dioxygenase family)